MQRSRRKPKLKAPESGSYSVNSEEPTLLKASCCALLAQCARKKGRGRM
jgi:hypothetical protein